MVVSGRISRFLGWLHADRDARPLAAFRIVFFSIMFLEVMGFEELMPLLVDEVPFAAPSDWQYVYLFSAWKVVLVGVILGAPSRFWRVANWIFSVGFFNAVHLYEYHMFYAWTGISFLTICADVNRSWSLETTWDAVKRARSGLSDVPKKVTNWDYYMILLLGVGFVYADSVLWKLTDPAWVGGLGMYRPASLPFISYDSWLTDGRDMEWLFRFLGGVTLSFEALFVPALVVLLNRKWWALLAMGIGIGLHGGIAMLFPLPLFGWGYAAFFILLWPTMWLPSGKPSRAKFFFYFDRDCPLCCQTRALLGSMDWLGWVSFTPVQALTDEEIARLGTSREGMLEDIGGRWSSKQDLNFGVETYRRALLLLPLLMPIGLMLSVPGIRWGASMVYHEVARRRLVNRCTFETCGIAVPTNPDVELISGISLSRLKELLRNGVLSLCVVIQLFISWNSGILVGSLGGLDRQVSHGQLARFSEWIYGWSTPLFGLTDHPVFMSFHFEGFTRIGTFTDGEVWWPLNREGVVLTDNGQAWLVWTWRIHSAVAPAEKDKLLDRFKRYLEVKYNTELDYRQATVPVFQNEYDPFVRKKGRVDFTMEK